MSQPSTHQLRCQAKVCGFGGTKEAYWLFFLSTCICHAKHTSAPSAIKNFACKKRGGLRPETTCTPNVPKISHLHWHPTFYCIQRLHGVGKHRKTNSFVHSLLTLRSTHLLLDCCSGGVSVVSEAGTAARVPLASSHTSSPQRRLRRIPPLREKGIGGVSTLQRPSRFASSIWENQREKARRHDEASTHRLRHTWSLADLRKNLGLNKRLLGTIKTLLSRRTEA